MLTLPSPVQVINIKIYHGNIPKPFLGILMRATS